MGSWGGTPHPRRRSYSPRPNGSAEIPGELRSPCCRPGFDCCEKGTQYRQPAGVRQEGTERRHDCRFVQHRREGKGSLRSSIHRRPPRKRKRLFVTRPVDRRDEENKQHHQCCCSIAWGRPIPRQGTLNYSIADDPVWIANWNILQAYCPFPHAKNILSVVTIPSTFEFNNIET